MDINEVLNNANFSISKQIDLPASFGTKSILFVDDTSKKFAISKIDGCYIFNYNDLLAYELNEDGDTITSGRGLQTAVGAMTFGVAGAVVGNAGKRKSNSTCNTMAIRLLLNNLNTPQLEIPCIFTPCKKKSIVYTSAKSKANDITAVLNYITNSAKQSQTAQPIQNAENEVISTEATPQESTHANLNSNPNFIKYDNITKTTKSKNKGCLIAIVIFLLISMIITVASGALSNNTSPDAVTQTADNTEAIKSFDAKTWSDFKKVFDAHKNLLDAMETYGSGKTDILSFYNYCKDMETFFMNVSQSLNYGETDEQKTYVDVIGSMAFYDQQATKSLMKYLDTGNTSDLSDAQENIDKVNEAVSIYAGNRGKLLKQAGYTDEQIETVANGMIAELGLE